LSEFGDEQGRAALLAAATGPNRTLVLTAVARKHGDDVNAVMLAAVRDGSSEDKRVAMQFLVGAPANLDPVIEIARHGVSNDVSSAISALAESNSPQAAKALAELARTGRGEAKERALEALGERGVDDTTRELLVDELAHGAGR